MRMTPTVATTATTIATVETSCFSSGVRVSLGVGVATASSTVVVVAAKGEFYYYRRSRTGSKLEHSSRQVKSE